MLETIFFIGIPLIILLFTSIKRNRQVGKTWNGLLSATVLIQDKELHCTHCGHNKFQKREGMLTTTWVTFFRCAFWNQSVPCYVCKNCRFIHWFLEPKEKVEIVRDPID